MSTATGAEGRHGRGGPHSHTHTDTQTDLRLHLHLRWRPWCVTERQAQGGASSVAAILCHDTKTYMRVFSSVCVCVCAATRLFSLSLFHLTCINTHRVCSCGVQMCSCVPEWAWVSTRSTTLDRREMGSSSMRFQLPLRVDACSTLRLRKRRVTAVHRRATPDTRT